ncbi:MAG: hypothetical protein VW455_12785 [Nitrospinota bacterium]
MRSLFAILLTFLLGGLPATAFADSGYEFQLYKNHENYGIVVFPKKLMFEELENYLVSIPFELAGSGKAVMRHGTKNENATYMMPLEVQKRHSIEKFIIIQILDPMSLMVGIYDPEWGLTLPSAIMEMETVKKNIPKTLNVFRGRNRQRQTYHKPEEKPSNANFSSRLEYNIIVIRQYNSI